MVVWVNVKDIGWKGDPLEKWMRSSRAVTTENEKGAESHAHRWKILFHCSEEVGGKTPFWDTDCKKLGFLNMEAASFVWFFFSLCK